jgi:tRNA A37 threonylcarbamoyladenosine dehydratase
LAIRPELHRLQLLTGAAVVESLAATRLILFGLGGVGSWCAEALVRSGVLDLTIVDSDSVCITNINRQIQATPATVGLLKTEAMLQRLADINPEAHITALPTVFDKHTADGFDLGGYAYVIDAIDSLSSKVELIMRASMAGAKVFTALGASNKLDPAMIKVGSLWDSEGCRLGRFVRKRLRRRGFNGAVTCVYSDEFREPFPGEIGCGTGACLCPKVSRSSDGTVMPAHEWCSAKKQINGSAVHITGIFGFMLAGFVIQDIAARIGETRTPALLQ